MEQVNDLIRLTFDFILNTIYKFKFFHDWNTFKSILLMLGIAAPIIFTALLLGGRITQKVKNTTCLFILIGFLVTSMISLFIFLTINF